MKLRGLKTRKAFTLVEIMIVVGIVILLGGMSIHGLLRARLIANEAVAMRSLRALQTALDSYKTFNSQLPEADQVLSALTNTSPPYLDSSWQPSEDPAAAQRQGYSISVNVAEDGLQYLLLATPLQQDVSGSRSFVLSQLLDIAFPPSSEIYMLDGGMRMFGDLIVPNIVNLGILPEPVEPLDEP